MPRAQCPNGAACAFIVNLVIISRSRTAHSPLFQRRRGIHSRLRRTQKRAHSRHMLRPPGVIPNPLVSKPCALNCKSGNGTGSWLRRATLALGLLLRAVRDAGDTSHITTLSAFILSPMPPHARQGMPARYNRLHPKPPGQYCCSRGLWRPASHPHRHRRRRGITCYARIRTR